MEQIKLVDLTKPISVSEVEKIPLQMKNNVCKIYKNNEIKGIGFLCEIPYPDYTNLIPVLITGNNILNENDIDDDIIIEINNKTKTIKKDKSRKKYTSFELNITVIEIIPNIDTLKLDNYLEIDEEKEIIENKNKSIYVIYYKNNEILLSFGLNYNIINSKLNIDNLSFGLIFSLNTYKIIDFNSNNNGNNKGIKYILNEFYKYNFNENDIKKNEIRIMVEIVKRDINKKIYFLENDNKNNDLKKLNDDNVDLFINNEKIKYQKYFIPKEEGNYLIKLKFKNNIITDCSYKFSHCFNLTYIDLSSFDTKYITNMSYMFSDCNNLTYINLSYLDTKNVTNMSGMFSYCQYLTNIDLSSFDTKMLLI